MRIVAVPPYLLALHAVDHDVIIALLALHHLALHLPQSVREGRPGRDAYFDQSLHRRLQEVYGQEGETPVTNVTFKRFLVVFLEHFDKLLKKK